MSRTHTALKKQPQTHFKIIVNTETKRFDFDHVMDQFKEYLLLIFYD